MTEILNFPAPVRLGVIIGLNDSASIGSELLALVLLIAGAPPDLFDRMFIVRVCRARLVTGTNVPHWSR
jgi:hypothetical protein